MNIFYGKVDFDLSDHKPITALFEGKIKVIDTLKKQSLIENITLEYQKNIMETE